MRTALLTVLLFSTAIVATRCVDWAKEITEQWRSIFIPDDQLLNPGPADSKPPSDEALAEESKDVLTSGYAMTQVQARVPQKFQRKISSSEFVPGVPKTTPRCRCTGTKSKVH
jgi:hypothetical protein